VIYPRAGATHHHDLSSCHLGSLFVYMRMKTEFSEQDSGVVVKLPTVK
jgi:hypothetical protein